VIPVLNRLRLLWYIDITCCLLLIYFSITKPEPIDVVGVFKVLISYGLVVVLILCLQIICIFVNLFYSYDIISHFSSDLARRLARASFIIYLVGFFLLILNGFLLAAEPHEYLRLIIKLIILGIIGSSHILFITSLFTDNKGSSVSNTRSYQLIHYLLTGLLWITGITLIMGWLAPPTALIALCLALIFWRSSLVVLTHRLDAL